MRATIDPRRLGHLVAAARCGSLSAAAIELGLTQPALSKSIREIEQELGVRVLERGRLGVAPTAYGEVLIARGRAIDEALQAARRDVEALRAAGTRVVIGCGPSEAARLLPRALGRLARGSPALRVTVLHGLNEGLMPMVKAREIAFALSSVPRTAHDPACEHEPLHDDTAVIVARSGHPLAGRRAVGPAELAGARWVLARRRELERRALDELFLEAGLKPVEADVETTSGELMKTLVAQSDHLTFLPREMIHWEERAGLLRALPVAAPRWSRSVGLTWLRDAPRADGALALAKAIRAAASSMRRSTDPGAR